MKGNLTTIPMTTLVQLIGQSGLTGRLDIEHQDATAHLFFNRGNVINAALGEEEGKNAFYQLLEWVDGEFALDTSVTPEEKKIETGWSDLLLEGLMKLDESTQQTIKERETKGIPDDIGKLFGLDKIEESNNTTEVNMANVMEDVLKELSQEVPGLITTAIVGMDGLGIAHYTISSGDPDAINAQATVLFKLVTSTLEKVTNDKVDDFLLTTDKVYLLLRQLEDPDYFLGILCKRSEANLGNMRLVSRTMIKRLSEAMPN